MKNLFLLCLLIDAHLGLVLAKFQVIAAIFEREIRKKAKKAHFYSILLYKPILKSVRNLFLLCLLIDAHLGLVLAQFQVIAAISEREIKKECQKSSFFQYFTIQTHTKIGEKSFFALFAYRCSLGACPCQVSSHCRDF